MKQLAVVSTRLLSLAGIVFLILNMTRHWNEIAMMRWNAWSVLIICLAIIFWVIAFLSGTSAWRILVIAGGGAMNFRTAFEINGKAQISKYLPGNVFHYVSRVMLASEAGVATGITTASMLAETIFAVCTAVLVTLSGFAAFGSRVLFDSVPLVEQYLPLFLAGFIVIGIVVVILFLRLPAIRRWVRENRAMVSPIVCVQIVLRLSIFYVGSGVFINLLSHAFWGDQSTLTWFDSSWRFTAAWLLGFLMPGAPGGIGIREAVLLGLFSPAMGPGPAAGLAIIVRLVSVLADLLVYSMATQRAMSSMHEQK